LHTDDGGEEGFDAFFRGSNRRLLAQAFLLTADSAKAQDLTQEAFERAWSHWRTVSVLEDPEAWTRKVLHNLCISDWRSTSRRRRAQFDRQPDCFPAPSDDHLMLLAALRSLSDDQARAIVLHDGLGYTVPEIAADMSKPEGTVKAWISRGRSRAAEAMDGTQNRGKEGVNDGR
jgi:RNA polymerase sigma factor (sigma-70 family)